MKLSTTILGRIGPSFDSSSPPSLEDVLKKDIANFLKRKLATIGHCLWERLQENHITTREDWWKYSEIVSECEEKKLITFHQKIRPFVELLRDHNLSVPTENLPLHRIRIYPEDQSDDEDSMIVTQVKGNRSTSRGKGEENYV